ncbi:MAG TPA: PAS domain S-box protein [Polyangiaceae bacterium]|nr:PAS domain S-box protein [Polyangiaceae bacterium]
MVRAITATGLKAIAASTEELLLLVSSVKDYAIFMLDPGGYVNSWNAGAGALKGYTEAEILGSHFSVFYPLNERAQRKPELALEAAARDGRYEDEGYRVRKDGSRFWASAVITALRDDQGRLRGFGKVTRDLTERKQREDELRRYNAELERRVEERTRELIDASRDAQSAIAAVHRMMKDVRESERRHRTLVEHMNAGVLALDSEGNTTFMSARLGRMLGREPRDSLGRPAVSFIVSAQRSRALEVMQSHGTIEVQAERDGLSPIWVSLECVPLTQDDGEPGGVVCLVTDLSAQRNADESIDRFAAIVDAAESAVFSVDRDRRITSWSRGAEALFGYTKAAAVGMLVDALYPTSISGELERVIDDLSAKPKGARDVSTQVREDGSTVDVSVITYPIKVATGDAELSIVMRDLTAQRRADATLRQVTEQVQQVQKMEALGRLAGGIAHDFNNMLSVIMSYAELLHEALGADAPLAGDVREIQQASQRAAALTRQLLMFSRGQLVTRSVVELNPLVDAMVEMLKRTVGEDVELSLSLADQLWPVRIDPNQFQQVILNLAVNARDAMPSGGVMSICTRNVSLDTTYVDTHFPARPGDYVMLSMTDTGVGMDAATREHIFEPFFTTKGPGKGTGLGLATVFGIVQQARGLIWVYSEPGNGTVFKVYLPRSEVGREQPVSEPQPALARGSETILLVEDEAAVRSAARVSLASNGYRVLEAPTPQAALDIAKAHPDEIHLLLTDVVMPEMNGPQLAQIVASLRPSMRILFMSGYAEDRMLPHGLVAHAFSLLEKPFTSSSLVRKVRETLDAERLRPD